MVFLPHEPTFFHGKPLFTSLVLNHQFLHHCAAVGLYLHRVYALGYAFEQEALLLCRLCHHLSLGVAQGDALRCCALNVQLNSRFIK